MHTYFLHSPATNRVKIGRSQQPEIRVRDITATSGDDLVLLGVLEGDRERELHRRFAESRERGEWFAISAELADFLKEQFHCVLAEPQRRGLVPPPTESWAHIVNRAELAFGCGLRREDYTEFCDAIIALGYSLDTDERTDDTEWGLDDIVSGLEDWWPWVMGWNVVRHPKPDGANDLPNILLLLRKPDNAPKIEHLCRDLGHWGWRSEEFPEVNIRVAICHRAKSPSGEWIGEILGPVLIDDEVSIWGGSGGIRSAILMDEIFGFRLLGDAYYRRLELPTPAEGGLLQPS